MWLEMRHGELIAAHAARRSSLDSIRGEIHQHEELGFSNLATIVLAVAVALPSASP